MIAPIFALLVAACGDLPPAPERKTHPLPEDRDGACQDACYMFRDGCDGACRMLVDAQERRTRAIRIAIGEAAVTPEEREARAARLAAHHAEEARRKAESAKAIAARDEAERIARTPAKTLRRRARIAARGAK